MIMCRLTVCDEQFYMCIAIHLFDWHGNVIVDAEVTQLIYRPSRSTGDMVLMFPTEDYVPPTEGALQTSYRSGVPPASLLRT